MQQAHAIAKHESLELHSNWRFAKGDRPNASEPEYDDHDWSEVHVPHDWAIAGPFDPAENGYAAKLPWRGVGWYRRSFDLDCQEGDRVYFDFDGVMAQPKVYINGKLAGKWDYGYTSFRIDATPFVNRKGRNIIAVRVDTTKHGTRWYPGAGIYRKVTLQIRNPIHIAHWGTFVTTPSLGKDAAEIRASTFVENHTKSDEKISLLFTIRGPDGIEHIAFGDRRTVPASGSARIESSASLINYKRWDVGNPFLYTLETEVMPQEALERKETDHSHDYDRETTTFGIREFKFTANDGFHLNGRRVQLHGVCLHHDQGPLGAAFYSRAAERQLQIMRDMGVNAIRTSHNPPAPELLDLCDRMGFVVWDECFDKWDDKSDRIKADPPLEEHAERHLRSLVTRDRNHPSVVIWSIANEISAIGGRNGLTKDRVAMMRDIVRKYDDTRPVGLAHHIAETANTDIFAPLDLVGWNYARRYATFRNRFPDKPIIYSESASALSTRGFYEQPLPTTKTDYSKQQHQVDSYDFNAAPWSDIADAEFKLMRDDPFVAGEFVWTGFDYLGEPTPFAKEAKNSYFGIVDLCGIPKDRYFLYRSYWRPDTTTVHIVPHWDWRDRMGKNVPVFVYTNGDSAELILNGHSLGVRRKGEQPKRPTNLARNGKSSCSSSAEGHAAENAADDNAASYWWPKSGDAAPWLQVDLGTSRPLKTLTLEFDKEIKNTSYVVKASDDNSHWSTLVRKQIATQPREGRSRTEVHQVDGSARYVRLELTAASATETNGIRSFGVFSQRSELPYYTPTYDYRLRWNDVVYEPGELKAIAYKNGQQIGTEVVRTPGAPVALTLTPDRVKLQATGEDLCYVLVEARDKDGTLCPRADNSVDFQVDGPAVIAAVGNGNPLSLEPFQAHQRKLFYGKAMLIVRALEGRGGTIHITASSDGLRSAETSCVSTAEHKN
jgi:beta-galactosidase